MLLDFCDRVLKGFDYRDELKDYLKGKMDAVAPNLTAFIGENVNILEKCCILKQILFVCKIILVEIFYS